MWAIQNAPAMSGDGAADEAADLCEYLASHGYVVLASRSLGTRTKAMNFDADGLDTQARDIRFLPSYAQTLPQDDMTHVAAPGWSWGGLANALAASQDSRIAALVSLDGTQYRGDTKPVSRSRVALPWLYVKRRPESVRELSAKGMETTEIMLNEAIYSDRYHLVMNPMEYVDFSTSDLRVAPLAHFTEYTRPEVEAAYHWTCRYTLKFLNATLKAAATSRQFLDRSPAQNGVPTHMTQFYHLPVHQGLVPTQAGLAAALVTAGFAHARDLYRQAQQQDPTFVLSEEALNTWGVPTARRRERRAGGASHLPPWHRTLSHQLQSVRQPERS
ncbi:dienelactone hydrolase family protein [Hymenobacter lapidiphilus]|uniref:Alpha/beta hydrolase n=1 Tax=Hymenobacter lapidiphilus TaxID=2608003 RepID=A0A7Y7PS99_9BACT|nr:hypothetical protein [Hymenobacter lapidiphilus]NVO33096.1 hypothetical protein [Hymenobacter lapidiphilus]